MRTEQEGRGRHTSLSPAGPFPAEGTAGESWWLSWTAEIKALSAPGQALRVGGRAAAQGPLLHLSKWHLGSRGMNDAPLGGGVGVPSAPCRAWGRGQEGGPGPQDGSVLPGGGHPPPPPATGLQGLLPGTPREATPPAPGSCGLGWGRGQAESAVRPPLLDPGDSQGAQALRPVGRQRADSEQTLRALGLWLPGR